MLNLLNRLLGLRQDTPPTSPKTTADSAPCPYCGVIISPAPARSRKCADCGERIVVRTQKGQREYLTESGAKSFDATRQAGHVRNDAVRRAEQLGLTERQFAAEEDRLRARDPRYSPGDVFWSLANEAAMRHATRGEWHDAKMAYFLMALYLYQKEPHREYWHLLEEAARCELRHYASQGLDRVKVIADDCPVCKKLNKKSYTVAEAERLMPIPAKGCTHSASTNREGQGGWCCCGYAPDVKLPY